jgi:hypothetical protein
MPRRERSLVKKAAKAAGGGAGQGAKQTPMQKFNDLARRVINVSREEYRQEQERYDAANAVRRAQRKRTGDSNG